MRAGMAQPGMIYAGLTSIMDYMDPKDKETFNSTLQKGMSMLEQVDRFQVRPIAQKLHQVGCPEGEHGCIGLAHCRG